MVPNIPAGGLPAGVVEFNEAKGFAAFIGDCWDGVAGVPPFNVGKSVKNDLEAGVAGVSPKEGPRELPFAVGAGVAGVVDMPSLPNENGGCGTDGRGVVAPT